MRRSSTTSRSNRPRKRRAPAHRSNQGIAGIVELGFSCFRLVDPNEQDVTHAFCRLAEPRSRMAAFAGRRRLALAA